MSNRPMLTATIVFLAFRWLATPLLGFLFAAIFLLAAVKHWHHHDYMRSITSGFGVVAFGTFGVAAYFTRRNLRKQGARL